MHDPIEIALTEDIGDGDLTSRYFIDPGSRSSARIFVKESAILAGIGTAAETFLRVDPNLIVKILRADGDRLLGGDTVLEISGKTASIVTAERVALNFLQRLSGISTLTNRYVQAIEGYHAQILDTRKTTPGLRVLEKAAVKAGGGTNHRMGLYDMVMLKDNHLLAEKNLEKLQDAITKFTTERPAIRVEIEADTLDQVRTFLTLNGVSVILLDNMKLEELRTAVELNQKKVKLEASGGVNLSSVRDVASTGVDFISVGALTHSAIAVDFSLEIT